MTEGWRRSVAAAEIRLQPSNAALALQHQVPLIILGVGKINKNPFR